MPPRVPSWMMNEKGGTYAMMLLFTVLIPSLLFSFFADGNHPGEPPSLQLVSIVFRHGARTPTHFYPNDPYKDPSNWPEGLGALTKEGKQQMYNLGLYLRQRYTEVLPYIYSPDDIYVFSSDSDRCLMSAQLCLAGLYPPIADQIWNAQIRWQPIPVHTAPRNLDKLIACKKPCSKYERELTKAYSDQYFTKINVDNAQLYQYLSQHSGMEVNNLTHVEILYNTLDVEAKLQRALPEWTHKVYNTHMRELAGLSLAALTYTDTAKRLRGGPLLKEIVEPMSQKVQKTLKPNRIMYLYSSHDVTMISLLRTLGFSELFHPDYGSALIFELHKGAKDEDHEVKLLYLSNLYRLEFISMEIPNCGKLCKLKKFVEITKPFIPGDWEAECA